MRQKGQSKRSGQLLCILSYDEKTMHRRGGESNVSMKVGSLNVCGCSTLEGKKEMIGRTFVEQNFDALALSET